MPLSPQPRRRRTPHATAGNHALANGDQTLTGVDARLTKVDRGCQNLTASTPAPFRRTPNKPEQIRTNLNKPERRQAPRPDRAAPRIAPEHPEKNKPEHRRRAPFRHSCASLSVIPAQAGTHPASPPRIPHSPIHPSPLPGGRLGGGWEVASQRRPLSPTPRSPLLIPAASSVITASPSVIPAPHRHSCAGRNPGDLSAWCAPLLRRRRMFGAKARAAYRGRFLPAQE